MAIIWVKDYPLWIDGNIYDLRPKQNDRLDIDGILMHFFEVIAFDSNFTYFRNRIEIHYKWAIHQLFSFG